MGWAGRASMRLGSLQKGGSQEAAAAAMNGCWPNQSSFPYMLHTRRAHTHACARHAQTHTHTRTHTRTHARTHVRAHISCTSAHTRSHSRQGHKAMQLAAQPICMGPKEPFHLPALKRMLNCRPCTYKLPCTYILPCTFQPPDRSASSVLAQHCNGGRGALQCRFLCHEPDAGVQDQHVLRALASAFDMHAC